MTAPSSLCSRPPRGAQAAWGGPALADLDAQSRVLIMSFSHAEDLDILAACLQRQRERADLPFEIGRAHV